MNRKIVLEIELDDRIPSGVDAEAVRRAIYGLRGVRSVVEVAVAVGTYGYVPDTRMGPR